MTADSDVDKRGGSFYKAEIRSICSSTSGDENALLTVETRSVSSFSSEGYVGYVNQSLEPDYVDAREIVETVLKEPGSPSLRITKSSEVHVGPSLTYNGPVTINLTVQPQSEHPTTPPLPDTLIEIQPEPLSQTQQCPLTRQPSQFRIEHPFQQHAVPPIQIHEPPLQEPVPQAQIQNPFVVQIQEPPQKPPLFRAPDSPAPLKQQDTQERVINAKQPQKTQQQRNLQTAYQKDFRREAGCQLIAAELYRKGKAAAAAGGAGGDMWCDQNLAIIALLLLVSMATAICFFLTSFHSQNTTPRPEATTTTEMAKGTTPNSRLQTEYQQDIKSSGSGENTNIVNGQMPGTTPNLENNVGNQQDIKSRRSHEPGSTVDGYAGFQPWKDRQDWSCFGRQHTTWEQISQCCLYVLRHNCEIIRSSDFSTGIYVRCLSFDCEKCMQARKLIQSSNTRYRFPMV